MLEVDYGLASSADDKLWPEFEESNKNMYVHNCFNDRSRDRTAYQQFQLKYGVDFLLLLEQTIHGNW